MGSNRAKKNIRTLRVRRSLLVLGLIAGLVGTLPVAASGYECDEHRVKTFNVKMRLLQSSYQPGDTARVLVKVTRELPQAASERNFDHDEGVPDVKVVFGLSIRDFVFADAGLTGETGTALIDVKIRRDSPSGWANANAYAWKDAADAPCATVREEGTAKTAQFIRINEN